MWLSLRRGARILGEVALILLIAVAGYLVITLAFSWRTAQDVANASKTAADVDRFVQLTSTLSMTLLTLVLAVLTFLYVSATRELVKTNKTLESIATSQDERTKPIFKLQNVEGVRDGSDGRSYFHFDVINEGWKDCGVRDVVVKVGNETVSLELVQRNRQSPTPLPEGGMHQPLRWIPESDFVVRAGDRRQLSGRGRLSVDGSEPAAELHVHGVLSTADHAGVRWREKRRAETSAR